MTPRELKHWREAIDATGSTLPMADSTEELADDLIKFDEWLQEQVQRLVYTTGSVDEVTEAAYVMVMVQIKSMALLMRYFGDHTALLHTALHSVLPDMAKTNAVRTALMMNHVKMDDAT